jgi:hypothetical protein
MIRDATALALEVAVRALLAPSVLASRWLLSAGPHGHGGEELPNIGRSPLVAAKVVFDEIFFMSEVLLARFVAAADRDRLRAEIADALILFDEAGWLADPSGYFPAPPALEPRAMTEASSFGRTYRHLTFASEYEPRAGEPGGERWHARAANAPRTRGCCSIRAAASLAGVLCTGTGPARRSRGSSSSARAGCTRRSA